ncbi:MAG: hypothetical protein ABSF51_05290 [Verrucomicrobiota bacterium]
MSENLFLLWRTSHSDFTRVSSGYYPILERFEPVGSACYEGVLLFLQSLLLAHELRFLGGVVIAVNDAVEK